MKIFGRIGCALGMLLLILDSRCALNSASEAVELVVHTAIPVLFPFFFLSGFLTAVPNGMALAGVLGGYPVGARAISLGYQSGQITIHQAQRLLPVYNQCGPAFIFGMGTVILGDIRYCIALWAIQIFSALLTGWIIGCEKPPLKDSPQNLPLTTAQIMGNAISALASVCGWIIIFRMIYGFAERWILWALPLPLRATICGLLELTNGCSALGQLGDKTMEFQLLAIITSFGGLCVSMQVFSVCHPKISKRYYFPGKALQASICAILAAIFQQAFTTITAIFLLIGVICVVFFKFDKKTVAFPKQRVYNSPIKDTRKLPCSLEKRYPAPACTAPEAPLWMTGASCASSGD